MSVNSHSLNKDNKDNRDNQQELLASLNRMADSQLHKDFLVLVQLKLEQTKHKMVVSPPADLLLLQGQARALHDLLTDLKRPALKDLLNKDKN